MSADKMMEGFQAAFREKFGYGSAEAIADKGSDAAALMGIALWGWMESRKDLVAEKDQLGKLLEIAERERDHYEKRARTLVSAKTYSPSVIEGEDGWGRPVRNAGMVESAYGDSSGLYVLFQDFQQLAAERDKLKHENAGLMTGYEAYEQVVRGLRGEVAAFMVANAGLYEVCAARRNHLANAKRAAGIGPMDDLVGAIEAMQRRIQASGGLVEIVRINPPSSCRQRLVAAGKLYPRSSCASCGQFSPRSSECDALIAAEASKEGK